MKLREREEKLFIESLFIAARQLSFVTKNDRNSGTKAIIELTLTETFRKTKLHISV